MLAPKFTTLNRNADNVDVRVGGQEEKQRERGREASMFRTL